MIWKWLWPVLSYCSGIRNEGDWGNPQKTSIRIIVVPAKSQTAQIKIRSIITWGQLLYKSLLFFWWSLWWFPYIGSLPLGECDSWFGLLEGIICLWPSVCACMGVEARKCIVRLFVFRIFGCNFWGFWFLQCVWTFVFLITCLANRNIVLSSSPLSGHSKIIFLCYVQVLWHDLFDTKEIHDPSVDKRSSEQFKMRCILLQLQVLNTRICPVVPPFHVWNKMSFGWDMQCYNYTCHQFWW
jgi:hypothetical protein